jgi:hypothetical protein
LWFCEEDEAPSRGFSSLEEGVGEGCAGRFRGEQPIITWG